MKKTNLNLTKQSYNFFLSKKAILFAGIVISGLLYAQNKSQDSFVNSDEALLNQFFASKGTDNISFDASNIKQFWIDKSVSSKNNNINIVLDKDKKNAKNLFKSIPLKIKLANVSVIQDCTIDVISDDQDLSFAVNDSTNMVISSAISKQQFVRHSVLSSSFHLVDTDDFSFYLQFSSNTSPYISINKIILSFSNDKTFLTSPGILQITDSNVSSKRNISRIDVNSFSVTGVNSTVFSNNKIFVSDNTITASATIKNSGDIPATVNLGYAPYTDLGQRIQSKSYPYGNDILTVISAEENSSSIVVDKYPEWKKDCYLALNAKSDLSDIPCFSFVPGKVVEIIEKENTQAEIIMDKALESPIPKGTQLRLHSPDGASYIYTNTKVLQPGESVVFSSSIKKDTSFLQYSRKAFSRDVFYVIPVILSRSGKDENTITITDFKISY